MALLRVTTTTICGTDLHIVRGEYAVRPGLVIGHEAAYALFGDRREGVLKVAISP